MLTLRIQHMPVLSSEQEAIGPLTALAAVLASASRSGCLWARLRGRLVPFDTGTIQHLLSTERSFHADDPGGVTHVFSLCGTPEGPGEIGVVLVNARAEAAVGAAPSLVTSVSLDEEIFETAADAVLRMVDACLDALSPDSVLVGPQDWLHELGAGWATLTREFRSDLLPRGTRVTTAASGALIIAHTEAPGSESPAAREAVARVGAALRGAWAAAPLAPSASPDELAFASRAQPTYLAAGAGMRAEAASDPAAGIASNAPLLFVSCEESAVPPVRAPTALIGTLDPDPVDAPRRPTLPFAIGIGAEPPPVLRARAPAALTGTSDAVEVPRGPALPFVGGSNTPPELTLEQYAALRAQLSLRGEEDQVTLQAFGVTSRAAKNALQARFAACFRRLVRQICGSAPAPGGGRACERARS